ncbi:MULTISPECIES: aldose epimerase family protein [unclassified Lentimonas]|uniref:aldose epimerase family protein n=1 Tax=unclassified Lentimonas TaxID=2630993 RepID=UPI001FD58C7E|nr:MULTISPECIES: aldose epimerase family protein [unclassified Lentimonas]
MKTITPCLLAMCSILTSNLLADRASITLNEFGEFEEQAVTLYTLTNEQGMVAKITDYGGVVVSLLVPDRDGKLEDVVLGFEDFSAYEADGGWYGAITGRTANRIKHGKFTIDDNDYQLATNNGPNHMHGGVKGFNKKLWKGIASVTNGEPQLKLEYVSPDGEEGFPGQLSISTTYTLTADNGLKIEYHATTDKPTICNITHHSYWNIGGPSRDSILEQELQMFADAYNPTDENYIPTGEIRSVAGTPFDFSQPKPIGRDIDAEDPQLKIGKGYDHNFVINGEPGTLRPVARLHDPESGRVMEMLSTDHGVQVYSGNWFDGSVVGRGDIPYTHRIAICFECQHFPDAINQPNFTSPILRPGEVYEKTTVYRFSVR